MAEITQYTARFLAPFMMEREQTTTLVCRVYRDGQAVPAASGTVTVYDATGTVLVNAAAVTPTSEGASYDLASATVLDSNYGDGWLVEFALVMPDGNTHTFRNDAQLVRRRLYPVVTDADLYRLHSDLDPNARDAVVRTDTTLQDYIDEAFAQVEHRLIAEGNRPGLVMSPSAFREVELYGALELISRDLDNSNDGQGKWGQLAATYERKKNEAWARLTFKNAYADDDTVDSGKRKAGTPTIWLSGGRPSEGRWR